MLYKTRLIKIYLRGGGGGGGGNELNRFVFVM